MNVAEALARLEAVRPCAGGYIARCPAHDDRTASLSVREGENGKLLLRCFAGCAYREILSALGGQAWRQAPSIPPASPGAPLDDGKRVELARRIWREAEPAPGTVVELYLRLRGLSLPPPPSIRFAIGRHAPSQTGPWPIMVAAVQNLGGEILAVHRTYLTGDGRKAAVEPVKMALGPVRGGAVRFAKAGEQLALCEGIETALSIQQATGISTWATLGTANLSRVELPDCVGEVIICADADAAGESAARKAAQKFVAEGRYVRIATPHGANDFNDLRIQP